MSPLTGKRIVITRPRHKAEDFAARLADLGAEPVIIPAIAIEPPQDTTALDSALMNHHLYDWTIFTSANTVHQVWQRFEALHVAPAFDRVAAVGPATARALQKHSVPVDVVPDEHVAEGLYLALAAYTDLAEQRILLPQSAIARPVLADLLREAGAHVDAVTAYRTLQPDFEVEVHEPDIDAITFTSSSTAANFAELVTDFGDAAVVCIGPITAQTCRELGWEVAVVADPHTIDGLIDALITLFSEES